MTSDYLPVVGSGHILLTTCAQFTGTLAHTIDVEKMDKAEGTLLLRRARVLANDAPLDQATQADRSTAEAIVAAMDGLPLALDQAGAYIDETSCGLAGYLDLYRTRRQELLRRHSKLPTDHPEPVATTWSLSFQKVERASPAAADLLRLCAFLDPDAIPEEIITEAASYLIDHYGLKFPEAARLLDQAASYLHDHALYVQAEPLYQRALTIKERVLGPDHSSVTTTLNPGSLPTRQSSHPGIPRHSHAHSRSY